MKCHELVCDSLGPVPFLIRTIKGISLRELDPVMFKLYEHYPRLPVPGDKMRIMLAVLHYFMPSVAQGFIDKSIFCLRFPDDPPVVYDNCILFYWHPTFGRTPAGLLKEARCAVKLGETAFDPGCEERLPWGEYQDMIADVGSVLVSTIELASAEVSDRGLRGV